MRVALYVRVSTQEQKLHGYSIDNQLDALKQYCEQKGHTIVAIYNDAGLSARCSYKKRPAMIQLLKDCKAGKFDEILFTKIDRWFRNIADYYEIQRILDSCHVNWRTIFENYDTHTSNGVFAINIMLSVSQQEADRDSERQKFVNEYRRSIGLITYGRAPTGYKVVKSKLYKDKETEEAITAMFNEFLVSESSSQAHKVLLMHGCRIARETLGRMLRNPTYCGNAYGIPCEAYITPEQFDRIQFVLDQRKTRRSKLPVRVYIFSGIIKCPCCGKGFHSHMRSMKSGGKIYYYKYYQCGRASNGLCENKKSITEKKIEKILLDIIEPELNKYIISIEADTIEKTDTTAQKNELQKRLTRIGDRYELGEIERDEYIKKVKEIKRQLAEIKEVKKEQPKRLPSNWKDIYAELDDTHKKSFWSQLLKKIEIENDELTIYF